MSRVDHSPTSSPDTTQPPGAPSEAAGEPATGAHAAAAVGLPRRRHWFLRAAIAAAIVGALAIVARRYYDELWRLRNVPPLLVVAIAALWLGTRYLAADVMRVALRALGHRIGRYEAFMLQMIQSYGNTLIRGAGIGGPAVYLKLRHAVPFADLSAVQLLPMTLLQICTIGVMGLGCQVVLWKFFGRPWERPLTVVFAAAAAVSGGLLLIPLPVGRAGAGLGRLKTFIARLVDASHKLGRFNRLAARAAATHSVMLLLRAWRIQLCFAAIGQPVHYFGALAASLLADLAFGISVTPAALGFREGAIVYGARVMQTNGDMALAAAVLDRVVGTACTVIVGQIGLWQLIRPALRAAPPPSPAAAPAPPVNRSAPE